MKAVVLRSNNKLELKDVPRPIPKKDEVIVKVMACGICGSDLRYLKGENPWSQQTLGHYEANPDNMILGHEFMGVVVEVGDNKYNHLIGKRVVAIVYNTCKSCEFCRTNRENLCKNTKHIGHGAGWENMEYYPGGMAEYCQVWADHCYLIDNDNLSDDEASTVDFMAIGLSAVKKAHDIFAQDTLVIGAGPVGVSIIQFLKLYGAKRIIVTDINNKRLEIAKEIGADLVINPNECDAKSKILEYTNKIGCRGIFDTYGSVDTQKLAFEVLGTKGEIVNVVCNSNEIDYKLRDFNGEKSIVSVANSPYKDLYETLKMLEVGKITAKPIITSVLPLSNYEKAFNSLLDEENLDDMKIVLHPQEF